MIRAKAPLRLGLAGGGTDVSPYCDQYGGMVLNATIDMYAYATVEPLKERKVVFVSCDREKSKEFSGEYPLKFDEDFSLHVGVYNRIVKDFNNGLPLYCRVTTYSDAPAGSGLGSSSTMVVAILKAFVEWLNLPLGEYEVANLAYQIERKDIGFSGGRQDQYAATFGGVNFMEFYREERVIVNPLRIKDWVLDELELSLVLYYTGASRESAKIISEQMENVKRRNIKSIEAMHELKRDAIEMKEAILRGDIKKFAAILGKSWEAKKKMANSISNDYIEQIYSAAINAGAYSGKVSGAGGGGFMIFVVDPVKRLQLIRTLNRLNGHVVNFHFTKDGTKSWRI